MFLDPLQPPEAVVLDGFQNQVCMGVVVVGADVLVLIVVVNRDLQELLQHTAAGAGHEHNNFAIIYFYQPRNGVVM